MASLFNTRISDTYSGLIKTIDNAALTASLKELTDGSGLSSGLYMNNAGDFKVTAILEFGSLKDTGENIIISKFVDAADGIGNNDNDTTIPTTAAIIDYVAAQITIEDLDFTGDTGSGQIDLDSQIFAIGGTTNEITTVASGQSLTLSLDSTGVNLPDNSTAITQTAGDNSTKIATTSYVDTLDAASDLDFSGDSGTGDVNLNTQIFAVTGTANQIESTASNQGLSLQFPSAGITLPNGSVATTQSAGDNSTKVATTSYVDTLDAASDLDITDGTNTGDVNLNTQSLSILGTTNEIDSVVSGQSVTLGLPNQINVNVQGNLTGNVTGDVTGDLTGNSAGTHTGAVIGNVTGNVTGDVTGDLTGNADTATAWETARDLSLTGQATGTISSVDGTNNVSGAVTLDNNSVTGKVLTGLTSPSASSVLATDTIVEGFGKLQSQVNGLAGGLRFMGSWDADTNSPVLSSGGGEAANGTTTSTTANKLVDSSASFTSTVTVGDQVVNQVDGQTALVSNVDSDTTLSLDADIMLTGEAYTIDNSPFITQGHYYVVSVGGTTTLNGVSNWTIGDWVIAGANNQWTKLDHSQVDGTGTTGNLTKWSSTSVIADSIVSESGSAITVDGSLSTNTNLSSTGNFAVNTDKFTVAASSGNTAFTGDLAINTNKFTVNATSGNTVVAGTLSIASGSISVLGGNNMTLAGAASHGGISFATNSILPATAAATNDNVFDIGASTERFKNLYLGGSITSGGGATFAGSITGTTSSFVSTVAGTTVISSEGNYASSGSVKLFEAKRSGGAVAGNWSYDDATTSMSLGTSTSHSFSLKTGNTRALTIDSSGNSTFAGSVNAKLSNIAGLQNMFNIENATNTSVLASFGLNLSNDQLILGSDYGASFLLKTNGTTALTIDTSQNSTFAGSIQSKATQSASTWIEGNGGGLNYGMDLFLTNDLGSTQGATRLRSAYGGIGTAGTPNFSISRSTTTQAYNSNPNTLTYSESLVIDGSNGNATFAGDVGIGGTGLYTTSHSLNIDGTGLAIKNNVNGSSNNWSHITNTDILSSSNLVFTTGAGIALTLNHDKSATFGGNVNVQDNLYLQDGSTTRAKIQLNASDTDDLDIKAVSLGSNMKFFTVDTERMRITSTGVISIGPSTTSSEIYFNYNNTNNKGGLKIDYSTGELRLSAGESGNGYHQAFYTNGSERMRIDSSGNVLTPAVNTNTTVTIGVANATSNSFASTKRGNLIVQASSAISGGNSMGGGDLNLNAGNSYSSGGGIAGDVNIRAGYNTLGATTASVKVYTGNTERMRIASSGDVGIGTDSPVNKLGIEVPSNSNTKAINIYSKNTSPNSYTSIGSQYSISNAYVESEIRFGNETQNGGGSYLGFVAGGSNTGNTEKMRISSQGDIGFNTTFADPDADCLFIEAQDNYALYSGSDGTGGSNHIVFGNANSWIGSITTNGSTTTYNTTSDYRLKEDLQDFAGLDMVSKIPVYDFKWKTDESRSYGVMAHELQEVLPDAVSGEKDAEEMQSVDYSKIVPLLVKSIQELKAEVDKLKQECKCKN